jgi:hypothetical protein
MAKYVLTDVSFVINGVDLSSYVRDITIDTQRADVDTTTMGATGMGHAMGLRDEKVTVKWAQDHAAAKVDATLWPIYTAGTSVGATIKPTSATVSNTTWSGSIALQAYQPISGAINVLSESQTAFVVDGVLTRATI